MAEIAILVLTVLSFISIAFVIFLFLKLSNKFQSMSIDLNNAFKGKDQISILTKKSEDDLNALNEKFVSFTKQLQEFLNKSLGSIREDSKKTSDLLEDLNNIVNEKNQELDRFKKGYDLVRMRAFVLDIINAISFLQNNRSRFSDNSFIEYLNAYESQLLQILNNLSIQKFSPNIGDITTNIEGINVIDSVTAENDQKTNSVAEIVSAGFQIDFKDGRKEILKPAEVKVFK
tara:strand:+ start:589 stop:1281 length:693 start_codon:yes stop_codon:yes gene_type:complete